MSYPNILLLQEIHYIKEESNLVHLTRRLHEFRKKNVFKYLFG